MSVTNSLAFDRTAKQVCASCRIPGTQTARIPRTWLFGAVPSLPEKPSSLSLPPPSPGRTKPQAARRSRSKALQTCVYVLRILRKLQRLRVGPLSSSFCTVALVEKCPHAFALSLDRPEKCMLNVSESMLKVQQTATDQTAGNWNSLPGHIRSATNKHCFKRRLKLIILTFVLICLRFFIDSVMSGHSGLL